MVIIISKIRIQQWRGVGQSSSRPWENQNSRTNFFLNFYYMKSAGIGNRMCLHKKLCEFQMQPFHVYKFVDSKHQFNLIWFSILFKSHQHKQIIFSIILRSSVLYSEILKFLKRRVQLDFDAFYFFKYVEYWLLWRHYLYIIYYQNTI